MKRKGQKEQTFWQVVRRFLMPVSKNKFIYARAGFIYFMWSCWSVLNIYFLTQIVNILEQQTYELYSKYLIIYVISFITYAVITFLFRKYWWSEVMFFTTNKIYPWILKKFIKLDNTSVEIMWTWKLVSIIEKWILTRNYMIHSLFLNFFSISVSFVFVNILIAQMWVVYLLWFYILLVFVFSFAWYHNNKALRNKWKIFNFKNSFTRQLVKIIMSKNEIMWTNKINKEIQTLDHLTKWVLEQNMLRWTSLWCLHEVPKYWINIIRVVTFLVVWIWIINWNYEISILVWIISSLTLLDWVMDNWLLFYKKFTEDFIAVEKLWEFLDTTQFTDIEKWNVFSYVSWDIKIQDLQFSYEKTPVFKDLNLTLKGWTKTAFVGESWWGKTTLIKLLAGYIKPDQWGVEVDGQKLSEVKLNDYYKHIGYLTQDPSIFDWTIHENLTYALDYEPEDKELKKVITSSKCEFIWEFENWMKTEIWERWVRLSWWQKQRLAIAKIMLKNPNIILLDEPTSALDSFNEEQINIALHNLFRWKTVIVVAHRLQTVKGANRILLFEQGEIIEDWTHKELVELDGRYKRMLDLQSGF